MTNNSYLNGAKTGKNDEFYTQLSDIENELNHYKLHFKGKVVYCNCDNPAWSNFPKYFLRNFANLGLKKLICTYYSSDGSPVIKTVAMKSATAGKGGYQISKTPLKGNGDFRSDECIRLLAESDIVVTNPPFSLFREFMTQLIRCGKKFIIVGNQNAIAYKEVFPSIMKGKLWLGYGFKSNVAYFINKHYTDYAKSGNHVEGMIRVSGVVWYTNLDHAKRYEPLVLTKDYNPAEYPRYDNYDAIEVGQTKLIPRNYRGVMGVPITALDKLNPMQVEIIGLMTGSKGEGLINGDDGRAKFYLNGKGVYSRILIKKKN